MFEFFDSIYQFLTVDMWLMLEQYAAYIAGKFTIAFINFKIYIVTFAWQVGQSILNQLNVTAAIESAWGNIDSETYSTLSFFRIPEAINIIVASYPAKLFLRMIGI